MRSTRRVFILLAVLVILLPVSAVEQSQNAAAQVMVTNVTIRPQVFMVGDTGTITVEVINNGAQSVAIRRVTLYDESIRVESHSYDTTQYLGAGNRMSFTFTVRADVPEGIYYPTFSMDFRDAGYLRYPVKLQVQDQPLSVSVLSKPDTFTRGKKDTVEILIGNPRDNAVSGVTVYPTGDGIEATPTRFFIGMLAPDQAQKVSFSLTPSESTVVAFHVDYYNGMNAHTETISIPIDVGKSKVQAELLVSNVVVERSGSRYTLTGDVTNAGLEAANAVVITTGEGAVPADPYRQYVVGTLQPDDFSGFEVTFTVEGERTTVPLLISHKDADGNLYTATALVDIPARSPAEEKGERPFLPLVGVIIACAAVIGTVIWHSWRKG
ncbi:MAG: hypothetical protein NQU46_02520 [Methanolinea sp.]|nr:hypothetical protein [Methanolinea sp.]